MTNHVRGAAHSTIVIASLVMLMVAAQDNVSKVIGGLPVGLDKSPFDAQLEGRDNTSAPWQLYCGVTIVDKLHAITAGHCIGPQDKASVLLRVRVGAVDVQSGGTVFAVAQGWSHPKYKDVNFKKAKDGTSRGSYSVYDIGVVRLAKQLTFGTLVAPAKLIGLNEVLPKGTKVILAAWGLTKYPKTYPKSLERAIFSVVEPATCVTQWRKDIPDFPVDPRFLCVESSSKAQCYGDSGSAYYNRADNKVAGLASFSTCGVLPAVATNLANPEIRSFIREKTMNSNI